MNNQKYLPHLDRIVGIIYKEINLGDVIFSSSSKLYEYERFNRVKGEFDLSNTIFKEKIRQRYFEIYPSNYNYEEIDMLLVFFAKRLEKKYQSTNAVYLFPLVAEYVLKLDLDEIYVKFDDLLEWDGFINKVDSNIIISALLADKQLKHKGYSKLNKDLVIKHDNKRLNNLLQTGISENHMHLKASGYITEMNWWYFKRLSIFENTKLKNFILAKGTFPNVSDEPETVRSEVNNLQKVKFISLILEDYLFRQSETTPKFKETNIIDDEILKKNLSWSDIQRVLVSSDVSIQLMEYANFIEDIQLKLLENEKQINDPTEYFTREQMFLTSYFTMILEKKLPTHIQYLFNIYILGINYIKLQFIQDNIGMGFTKFKEKEDNKEFFVPGSQNKQIFASVFDKYYREGNVKKIEFRIGPKETVEEYFELIDTLENLNQEYFEKYRLKSTKCKKKNCEYYNKCANCDCIREVRTDSNHLEKIKYGLIVHYIKIAEIEDTFTNIPQCRNEILRLNARSDAEALINFFEKEHLIDDIFIDKKYLNKIIGIDTANYELGVRPEVFGQLFREHREAISETHRLHFTFHVGEEFNTLSNGLRAIDEVIEFLNFGSNDRLGHALALGIESRSYYQKKRKIITSTVQDYIDDIIWLYQLLGSRRPGDHKLLMFLEREYHVHISKMTAVIYERYPNFHFTIRDYVDSYQLRSDNPEYYFELEKGRNYFGNDNSRVDRKNLDFINFRGKQLMNYQLNSENPLQKAANLNPIAQRLYYFYHYDKNLKQEGDEQIIIEATDLFIKAVEVGQEIVREKILERNIFIEANPSSNKKISSVAKYIDLPVLQMNRHHLENDMNFINVPVSINTDDSAIFQTNLSNEYALVAAALIREGYEKDKVMDYMEYLAKSSMSHSFVN